MLKVVTKIELVRNLAKASNKFCIYISTIEKDNIVEIQMAIPFLSMGNCFLLADSFLVLTFDTEKEMEEHFDRIVGDDGPTITNGYDGEVRVYALTCSNKGELLDENT